MIERWNKAPWTARGLKFKTTVETILGSTLVVLVIGIIGWIDTY